MTGHIGFDFAFSPKQAKPSPFAGEKLRVLILADFAGHHRPSWLVRRVDPDNLDALVAAVAPKLCLQDPADQNKDCVLTFASLDDFHPDELYRRLPAFTELAQTRLELSNPNTFAAAAAKLRGATQTSLPTPAEQGQGSLLLSSLLGGSVTSQAPGKRSADHVVEAFLKSAVAPHITPQPSSEQTALIAAADTLRAERMRRLLNNPVFARLEAAWRALERLVGSVSADANVELWISAHGPQALADDLQANKASLEASLLAQTLQDSSSPAFSLVAVDAAFGASIDSLLNLGAFAAVVAGTGATLVAGADAALTTAADQPLAETWSLLRQSPLAAHVALAGPEWLLRLPYGPRRNEVHAFAFDELNSSARPNPAALLWGGAAWAVVEAVVAAWAQDPENPSPGAATLGDIPIFTFIDEQGEKQIYPATGAWLAEAQAEKMLATGLIPLVAHRDRALITMMRLQSIAQPPTPLPVGRVRA